MQYALIGHPLGHSLSPRLHALLAAAAGRQIDYALVDLPPEELPARLPALLASVGGLNVTIPHKQAVLPFLTRLDESAARYDSVNTIAVRGGEAVGYNTDCVGFSRSICAFGAPKTAVVVGAGGVGRTFALELARQGCAVTIGARPSSIGRARELAAEAARRYGVPARAETMEALHAANGAPFDLLANASPCGMFPHADECPVSETLLRRCRAVFDSIYNPRRTRLVALAGQLGIPAMGGMRMLVWQAAAAQEIWMGARFSETEIGRIEEQLLSEVTA